MYFLLIINLGYACNKIAYWGQKDYLEDKIAQMGKVDENFDNHEHILSFYNQLDFEKEIEACDLTLLSPLRDLWESSIF